MSHLCGASKKHIFNLGQALSLDINGRYWVGRHFSQSKECTIRMEFNINGVHGSISLLKVKVTQSSPTICELMDYTIHGIHQTRILKWVAVPFSRGSSQSRDQTLVSCTADRHFTIWATREAHQLTKMLHKSWRSKETFPISFSSQYYPDTKIRQKHCKERK